MKSLDLIILFLSASFVLSLLFYLIYGKFTERKFNAIADKFNSQFGYTPFSMIVGKSGGLFFWGYKESYLICALFFTNFPATKKTLTQEEVQFFKELSSDEISWFYRKYIAIAIGLLSFIGLMITFNIATV